MRDGICACIPARVWKIQNYMDQGKEQTMKRQTKWLFAALFVLMGVFLMPKAGTEVQAASEYQLFLAGIKTGEDSKTEDQRFFG